MHVAPLRRSVAVTRLHFRTEDGFPEVYLVLSRVVTPSGRIWLKIALPMRPNGTTGWVLRGGLGDLHSVTTWLVIDRQALRVSFLDRGQRLWSAPVGVGKPSQTFQDSSGECAVLSTLHTSGRLDPNR